MSGGYLKLYRSMTDWEWYKDTNTKVLWFHILLKVNWKAGRFEGIEVPEGSFITSTLKLSEETGLSRQQVRTSLKHLKSTNEITTKSTNGWTQIFVEKWKDFQVDEEPINQQTNQQTNHQLTNDQPTTNQRLTTIEEYKKDKKGKNDKHTPSNFDIFWNAYPKKIGKENAVKAWMKIKPDEALLQKMLTSISLAKKTDQWQKQDGQFIPYPATWLNQERWEDDISTYSRRTSSEGRVIEDDRFSNVPF